MYCDYKKSIVMLCNLLKYCKQTKKIVFRIVINVCICNCKYYKCGNKKSFQRVLRVAYNWRTLENHSTFQFKKHASTETSVIFRYIEQSDHGS